MIAAVGDGYILGIMTSQMTRLILLANKNKAPVIGALDELRPWLCERAEIVAEPELNDLAGPEATADFPPADLAVVLGGDGTLLALAQHAVAHDLPILGVNFGKLGFLAEFNLKELQDHWDAIVADRCRTSQRLVLDVTVYDADAAACWVDRLDKPHRKFRSLALNDAVITAGEPFRMVDLEMAINPSATHHSATTCTGDGIIVSTPSGSTAYNLSAGGPIVSPDIDAVCITPVCPHSLAFRPIVINADDGVCLRVLSANEGTTLVIDGRVRVKLGVGEQVFIRRNDKPLRLIHNPRLNYWKMLAKKMHWAARPRNGP